MVRNITVLGMLVTSVVVLAASDASAVWINGKWVAKGVKCTGEATVKNVDNNPVTIACSADITPPLNGGPNVKVVCQNPGGNISIGNAFVQTAIFDVALVVPNQQDVKKGKTTFSAILGTGGLAPEVPGCNGDIYCNCDNDPTGFCQTLREASCPNDNWAPVDVVPITMTATAATYFCDNDNGQHSCPCDPTITNPTNAFACASATCSNPNPWTFDWSQTGGLQAWAKEVSTCTLPNPDTLQFGEQREYDCTVILDEGC